MSVINLNYERFKTEYFEPCTAILLKMIISSDCSIDHTKIATKVEEGIINAYKKLYHATYKSIAAMLMDWDVADVSLSNIDLADTYMSQMYGIDGQSPVPYVTSLYDGLLAGRNSTSALLQELGIEIMGQDCVATDECIVNSIDIDNLISNVEQDFRGFEEGAEEYINKLTELVSDGEIESVAAQRIKNNMTNIHIEYINLAMSVIREFKQDIHDYIEGYRIRLPENGDFLFKERELSEVRDALEELEEIYSDKVSGFNSIIGQARTLTYGNGLTLNSLEKIAESDRETVEEALSELSGEIDRITEIIDDVETTIGKVIEADLGEDIGCLNEIAETMYHSDHRSSNGVVLNTCNLSGLMGSNFVINIEVENELYRGTQSGFAYYYLQIFDSDGNIIESKLQEFLDYCSAIGVDIGDSDNFLKGIEIYIEHLKEKGYDESTILDSLIPALMTPEMANIISNLSVGSTQLSGGMPPDMLEVYISSQIEIVDKFIRDAIIDKKIQINCSDLILKGLGLSREEEGKEEDFVSDFLSVFNINAALYPDKYRTLSEFYLLDPDNISSEEYRQYQIEAMMALAFLCSGYKERSGNQTIFGVWYGRHTYWCGQFVSFLLSAVGLAGETEDSIGALTIGDGKTLTVADIKTWGALAYNFGSDDSDTSHLGSDRYYTREELKSDDCEYIPQVGDIVITTGTGDGHVCIIYEVHEDGTFITIDGNSSDQVKVNDNDKKSYDSIVGIVDIHSL